MGCYTLYCPLCGGAFEYSNNIKIDKDWIQKIVLLYMNDTVETGFQWGSCGDDFHKKGKKGEVFEHPFTKKKSNIKYVSDEDRQEKKFIALHEECWKYTKKELKFSSFGKFMKNYDLQNTFNNFSYPSKIKGAFTQFWLEFLKTEKEFMYFQNIFRYAPTNKKASSELKEIIKKNYKKIKSANKSPRPSPTVSATIFKQDTQMKGNDGNMYVVKKNKSGTKRWVKV
jgi:hypothetical protein